MSDSYLIDGYNLIHALGMIQKKIGAGDLEAARRWLLDFLVTGFAADAGQVTIVFDAKQAPRGVARQQEHHGLHVDFAPKHQSADDRIEELIEQAAQPKQLIVISNDARLQNAAKRRGAAAWTHENLLDFIEKKMAAAQPAANVSDDDHEPKQSAEEMKRWLKEFGSLESDPELREFFDHDRFE